MESKKHILSGAQPTGHLHLGNYFGAIKNWVRLQNEYSCKYGVMDCHSQTMSFNPKKLRENTWNLVFQYLALGVKPENVFIQSLIPEHTELAWILGCVGSYGELSRMTQFKDKSTQSQETSKDQFISAGLFYYPILQAADILIYNADYVPVGKDQQQHLELSRNIAQRFNSQFKVEYFKLPEYLFTETPKIFSLADPNKKMSKSLGEKHYVNLFGDLTKIHKQFKSAVTDSGQEVSQKMSPGIENLFEILRAADRTDIASNLTEDYHKGSLQYSVLKESVFTVIKELLQPFQEKYREITSDKKKYKGLIKQSSSEIRKRAQETVKEVKEITGLMNVL